MLTQLTISDFAIVKSLDIELSHGMTTITGETGAGKSIAIDALSLCLGSRAESSMVRPNGKRADVCATFNIERNKHAQKYLTDSELDNEQECILRRTVSKEGRSKGYINGRAVPVSQLKEVGQHLLNIHGQHAHQGLLNSPMQLSLLDQYANHTKLVARVELSYQNHHYLDKQLRQLRIEQANAQAQSQLLQYQVEELDSFELIAGEFEKIEAEHQRLANSENLQATSQQLLDQLSENSEYNIEQALNQAITTLDQLLSDDPTLTSLNEMLNGALIQVQESSIELNNYNQSVEQDPQRLSDIEERLSKAMQLARKHHVEPAQLPDIHQYIRQQLDDLSNNDQQIAQLEQQLEQTAQQFKQDALKLSESRQRSANKLEKLITQSMRRLAMEHAQFKISLTPTKTETISKHGIDDIAFKVSTNPGQPLEPLNKVVSGGELSRISLAISVITANKVATPTLIFDEVDVGISGPTAATVGQMLRELGQSTQILCVTHLPQVAGCGHHQMQVVKQSDGNSTNTSMVALDHKARVCELARLLGGNKISDNTLANAQELLIENYG